MGDPSVQLSFQVAWDIRMVSYVFRSVSATINLHSSVTCGSDSGVLGPPTGLLSVCILVPFQIFHWVSARSDSRVLGAPPGLLSVCVFVSGFP